MAEKNENELWRQTTVLIRADIFALAQAQGIDIGSECNRALAARLGIGYDDSPAASAPQKPVIIAPNAAPLPEGGKGRTVRQPSAIINADDPRSPKAVKSRKNRPGEVPGTGPAAAIPPKASGAALPPESPPPAEPPIQPPIPPVSSAIVMPAVSPASVTRKTTPGKSPAIPKKKEDPVKRFCSTMILRTDVPGAAVPKDEMYEIFGRWCREHHVSPVPEKRSFSVALKNKFAMTEGAAAGIPSWTGVKVK